MQTLHRKTFSTFWAKASNGENRSQIWNVCKNFRWEVICFGKSFFAITKEENVFSFIRLVFVDYIKHFLVNKQQKNMENIFQIIYYAETNRA